MKNLRKLVLAAIAALGLMAFVGASASATTLFTNSNLTSSYASGTALHLTSSADSSLRVTGSSGEVLMTCADSTVEGNTSHETGATVSGAISSLTWTGCSVTTDTVATGALSIEKTGTNEGKVVGSGSEWTVNIFGVSCVYGTGNGTTLGTISGGEAPVLHISAVGLTKTAGGFLCPSTTGWDAEYTFTEPHSLYIGT